MFKTIFVFGSNTSGIHGAGAAKYALDNKNAVYGVGFGHTGDSFAIPTKDQYIQTLPLEVIKVYVEAFKEYAKDRRKLRFQVTRIGCGLAGYTDEQIAPMFIGSPTTCKFSEAWKPWLGDEYNYFKEPKNV